MISLVKSKQQIIAMVFLSRFLRASFRFHVPCHSICKRNLRPYTRPFRSVRKIALPVPAGSCTPRVLNSPLFAGLLTRIGRSSRHLPREVQGPEKTFGQEAESRVRQVLQHPRRLCGEAPSPSVTRLGEGNRVKPLLVFAQPETGMWASPCVLC